jgi:uncharacterized membrane protein
VNSFLWCGRMPALRCHRSRRGRKALSVQFLALAAVLAGTCGIGHAQQSLQTLHNHVRHQVTAGQTPLVADLDPKQPMNLSIVLPLRNQTELTSLLQRLYDPSSPDFRHFLSVDEFTERFGPTASDYQAAVSFAKASGFTVTRTAANRLVVAISGTVDQVNSAFHVKMNVYRHPAENRTFYSPDREPSLTLSVPVAHIAGMNNFSLPHPALTAPQGQALASVSGSGPGGSYLASDMRAAYYGGTTLDGNGQAVALLELSGYNLSDVDSTFSNAGQSYNVAINNVLLDGATGLPDGDSGNGPAEVVLDIVQAIGMAPGLSQVRVYIGQGVDDANILNAIASENIAKQISSSWMWNPDDPKTDDPFFQEFAAQGQSFFSASGDYGAWDASVSPFFYPSEDQYVTAVGGTHLTTTGAAGAWASETAWNSLGDGSGGGISPDSIAIPGWQSGVANSANGGSATLRNVPDVSMEGDFDNYVCSLGSCSGGWAGTSFAAPRWAGFLALVNEQAVEAGTAPNGGVGFLNPSLYTLAEGSPYSSDFHDITSGNNDTSQQPVWFSAVSGYDLVTGWGSATGQHLIDDLAGQQLPGFWILGAPATVPLNQGGSSTTTINVTDAGGFTGRVNLAVASPLPSGVTASWGTNPTSGSSALTLTASSTAPNSTTTLMITGTSGNLTANTYVTVSIHAPGFLLSASPTGLGLNQGSSVISTVTVTPQYGFTGSVNLSLSGLPSGVTAAFSPSSTTGTSTLTLTANSTASGGNSTLTITGTSGNLTQTSTLTLSIHGPSFTLSAPGTLSLGQGTAATAAVFIDQLYGFTGNVNLSVSGLPNGVSASFSPNPATNLSTLTLTSSRTVSVGTSTLTITGTSGNLSATTNLTLGVYTPTFTLSSLGGLNLGQGMSSTTPISVNPQYGFASNVTLSVSGLPSGVTALWNPNPTTGTGILTLTASSSAVPATKTLTITGTAGNIVQTTTLSLSIYAPSFTLGGGGSVDLGQGSSAGGYITVNPQYGFTGKVNLSVSGVPSGVTASFSQNPATGFSNLNLVASNSAPVGTTILTVTGTFGSLTATTSLTLNVYKPTFTLSTYGLNMGQGTTTTAPVIVNQQYGFAGNVNLSVSGLPNGVTASFSPNPTTSPISTMTLTATSAVPVGQYTFTVTGTSGTQTATTTNTLAIYAPSFTLSGPGSMTLGQGSSSTGYVNINAQYGFSGSVHLSLSGLPSGVTASFSPNPTTGNSILTLAATSAAAAGQFALTITAVAGAQRVTMPLAVGIYAPSFTVSAQEVNLAQGSSGSAYVSVFPQYGFSGNVSLSFSGLPTGVTGSISPSPTAGTSVLNLTASNTVAPGLYPLTVTGTSGNQTVTTTTELQVFAPTLSLFWNPYNPTLNQGGTASVTFDVSSVWGNPGSVTFSISGLPSGVTASFSPNPTTATTTLTLTASKTAAAGNGVITITATSGSVISSASIPVTVNAAAFTISSLPGEVRLAPGATAESTIAIIPQYGFSGNVSLAAVGLPSGVTAIFSSNPAAPGNSLLTLTASNAAARGTTTLTITGTAGSESTATPLVVTVGNAPVSTSTTLQISSGGNAVTSVASGATVLLTAAVSGGSAPLAGQVNFCDATAKYCDAIHLAGSAQLTSAETATLRFIPGTGSHSYKAVFIGTIGSGASSSAASNLTVTASNASTTTISQSGNAGDYTLTATVSSVGPVSPGGTVSFLDTSNANSVLGTAVLGNSVATLRWQNPQSPAVGNQPGSIALADFNGDGILDMAVTNASSDTLTILLGNGDGTFTATGSSPQTGSNPSFVATGDFNRDGKADLAVANLDDNNVTILLGNGDGTFAAAADSPEVGYQPQSIAVGDFNQDGILDLTVLNAEINTVTVLLGNGNGTFTASPLSSQTGGQARSLVSADFNLDGRLDLAAVNSSGNTVTILMGNGDGSFTAAPRPATDNDPYAVAVGDFNLDGNPDLAVANQTSGTVTILLGNGDGTFTPAAAAPPATVSAAAVSVADLNGDGKPDLVVLNEYQNTLTILFGKGDGTFTLASTQTAGGYPAAVAVGDLNGDGSQDLAILNTYPANVSILTSQLEQVATATASGISPGGSGTHTVKASYPGDTSYQSSVSGTTQLTAELVTPTVAVTPSSSAISTDQPLTVSVKVSGGATPTGSITLNGGSFTSAATTLNNGTASIDIPAGSLAVGTDTLTVSYVPDSAAALTHKSATGSSSVIVTEAGTTVATSPFVMTAPTLSAMTPGSSATGKVTLTAGSSYSGTVNLTCLLTHSPADAQSAPTCSVNPTGLKLAANASGTVILTVNTTAASPSNARLNLWHLGGAGSLLAALIMFGIPSRRHRWTSAVGALLILVATGVIGCGGAGGSSGPQAATQPSSPATSAGSYTFTLTATDGFNSKLTTSTSVTFTVQ